MRLAWLFLTRSGKSNWNRLGLTAAAVALGILMLLVLASGVNALQNRSFNSSWRFDIFTAEDNHKPIEGVAPLKAKVATNGNLNKWQNEEITTISLRATGANSPELEDLKTPNEGEYYVSRGLDEVIKANPEEKVGNRFGSKQIGVIPDELSTSPDSLEVIRGMTEEEASSGRIAEVYAFSSKAEVVSKYSGSVGVILAFGGVILLFPVVMFISIATQLGSAQREKRYAALRLIGATRKQITRIITVESLSAALIGIVAGTLLYFMLVPLMSQYHFDGMRFWPDDLAVPISQYALIVALTLVFCLFANWWGMRHVQLSPLGVARSSKVTKKPRAWRLFLLVPGLVVFIWLSLPQGVEWIREDAADNPLPLFVLMLGVLSVMFGLVIAGPWLTSSIARLIARRTQNATALLASKRIAVQSRRIFRSVSGVVLALFAGSFYLTGVSGIDKININAVNNNGYSQLRDNTAVVMSNTLPSSFENQLNQQSYIKSAVPVDVIDNGSMMIDCQTLATYVRHTCPTGAHANDKVSINLEGSVVSKVDLVKDIPAVTGINYLMQLETNENLDMLRTFVASQTGIDTPTWIVSGTYAQIPIINPVITELANLAYAGMVVTLLVAIASLIVSTIGGLLERKRSFVTLRLSGMTVNQMERTVMIESLIPLISVSLLAAGLGVWIGVVFINALSDSAEPTLTPLYFSIVIGALLLALFSIRAVVPMLGKITRPEENQTE